jgi:hypothetical protein
MAEVRPPGTNRFEIDAPDITRVHGLLRPWEHTRDSTIFGASVHALVDETIGAGELRRFLEGNGVEVRNIRLIEPTLEDVFVTLTHAHDAIYRKGGAA